jgi:hypothetical protein
MFERSLVRRVVSLAVLTSYLSLLSGPTVAAVRQEVFARPKPLTERSVSQSELSQWREAMRRHALESRLRPASEQGLLATVKGLFTEAPGLKAEKTLADTLLGARERLQAEAARQDQALAATAADIARKKLPATIAARHAEAVKTIQTRRAQVQATLTRLDQAHRQGRDDDRRAQLAILSQQLEQWGGESAVKTDYKHLPWGSPEGKVRAPHESKLAYQHHLPLFGLRPLQLAGPLPPGTVLPVLPQLGAAIQPGDTAANEDVALTPAIQAKAAELGHNPARIYKWVYDSIEYIPSYGSLQGADYTLQTRRGNAFDTSSLLIALLRASQIPARYVYGTIEVPIDQAMNWVGGVTHPDAALNLMAQGGIPSIGVTRSGQFSAIRLEHVWVEAFVDYVPSRGARHVEGDSWIPLDASFKQYTYTPAMDLQQAVPFDAHALVTDLQAGATVDEANGYVQHLNQQSIETALTSYQSQVKTYLEQQQPNATVGDLLGTKVIQPYRSRMLAGTLQVNHIAVAGDFQTLPETMRHYFTFSVFADAASRDQGSAVIQQRLSLPALAGQFLALSFKPATADDEETISSYLPQPHADGSPMDPGELPQTLPGYLIRLTPELTLNGHVIAGTTTGVALGSEVITRSGFISPNSRLSGVTSDNAITAGEYHAIGINAQGMSAEQLNHLKTGLEATKAQLEAGTSTALTKHDLTGAILQTGVLSYFAQNDVQDLIAARSADTVTYRQPSWGTFSSTLDTQFSWGVPRSVSSAGVTMDIDRLSGTLIDRAFDNQKKIAFQLTAGQRMSANEHLIPEQLFKTETESAEGVSAVKALQLASAQGQRIYTITRANAAFVLPELTLNASAMAEIADAINAGRQVITSQHNISHAGWTGAGYIIVDMQTGAGAYKISGGENGSISSASTGFAFADKMLPAVGLVGSGLGNAIGYASFGVTVILGLFECYKDLIISIAIIFAVTVAAALIIGTAAAAMPVVAAVFAAFVAIFSTQAYAGQQRECSIECSKASKSQLRGAMPTSILDAEQFKIDEGYGPPTSPWDICACKDGTLVIYAVSQCGKIRQGTEYHITNHRWR